MKQRDAHAATLGFIDGLRARGVTRFEGLGIKLDLAPVAAAEARVDAALTAASRTPILVDATGDGTMVDPDVLGHEAGA